jgi:hypothetical protein
MVPPLLACWSGWRVICISDRRSLQTWDESPRCPPCPSRHQGNPFSVQACCCLRWSACWLAVPAGRSAEARRSVAGRNSVRRTPSACGPSSPLPTPVRRQSSMAVPCPCCRAPGQRHRIHRRATTPLSNPASQCSRANSICPASARQASIDGQPMPMPQADPRRIVVIGDTGCRIKVPASGQSPIRSRIAPARGLALAANRRGGTHATRSGDSPRRLSLPRILRPARALRATQDNGVVHRLRLGRLECRLLRPGAAAARRRSVDRRARQPRELRPRRRRLDALSSRRCPYQACPNQRYKTASRSVLANNLTADAYRIDLGQADAGRRRQRRRRRTIGRCARRRATSKSLHTLRSADDTPARPTRSVWLLIHKPLWYDLLDAAAPPNALQTGLAGKLPASLQFVFSGHQHAFQTINFCPAADPANYPAGRPAQVIVGASGTQLEAFDPQSPSTKGRSAGSRKGRSPTAGFTMASPPAAASSSTATASCCSNATTTAGRTLIDADGKSISRCRLDGRARQIAAASRSDSPVKRSRLSQSCARVLAPERQVRGRLVAVVGDRLTLQRQVAASSCAHRRIGDPVRRMHDGRREAARELVFAAGTGFEAAQPLRRQ